MSGEDLIDMLMKAEEGHCSHRLRRPLGAHITTYRKSLISYCRRCGRFLIEERPPRHAGVFVAATAGGEVHVGTLTSRGGWVGRLVRANTDDLIVSFSGLVFYMFARASKFTDAPDELKEGDLVELLLAPIPPYFTFSLNPVDTAP